MSTAAFARITDDGSARQGAFVSTARILLTVTLPLCLVLGGSPNQIVAFVYGNVWAPAAAALGFLGIVAAGKIFFELAYDFLVVEGRTRSLLIVQGIWLAVLLPSVIIGAHVGGIRGVAVSQAIVIALVVIPAYFYLLHRNGVAIGSLVRVGWKPLVGGAAAWFSGVAIGRALPDHSFIACALSGATGLVIVAVLILLDRDLRLQVKGLVRRRAS